MSVDQASGAQRVSLIAAEVERCLYRHRQRKLSCSGAFLALAGVKPYEPNCVSMPSRRRTRRFGRHDETRAVIERPDGRLRSEEHALPWHLYPSLRPPPIFRREPFERSEIRCVRVLV
jgi:hypothetical protein